MNKLYLLIISMCMVFLPIKVYATDQYTEAMYGLDKNLCTGKYQDKNVSTNSIAYFSYCMRATCNSNSGTYKYGIEYYYDNNELKNNNMIVNCLNGNSDPYVKLHKNGCSNYNTCNNLGDVKYCSTIWMYDCSKKSNGSSFTTTKKTTKRRTTKRTDKPTSTTTTQTTTVIASTKLKSLSLSKGSIIFNSDTYEYDVNLNEEDTFIEVTAVPEDSNATVEVKNNTNLVDGSHIEVIVSAPNSPNTVYVINIKKEVILSGNANLSSLNVTGYDLVFNSKITDYTLVINKEDTVLDLNYETEDNKASVSVNNNENLTSGSKITITVTAEDGTVKVYYINILVKAKSNTLGIIFIIILVIAILAGAYYMYKKFVLDKRGDKYEYE